MPGVPEETRAWRSFPQGPGADRAVPRLAGRQHGQIAIYQLHELGLDGRWAQRRIGTGRLHRVHRGVYSVGHRRADRPARWMAAVLAGGPAALLSHLSAGALWDLPVADPDPVEITVPAIGRRRRPGLRVHASTALVPDDRARRRSIPVTSLPRTLLDLADGLP